MARERDILIVCGGILVGVLVAYGAYKISKPWVRKACVYIVSEADQQVENRRNRVVTIEAVRTKLGNVSRRVVTVGKLEANKSVMVRSEMAGKIKDIGFVEGQDVHQGDLLFQFEDSDLLADYNQAKAELAQYEASYGRIAELRSRNIESVKSFDEVLARRDIAKAKVEAAEARLNKAKIVASFDGTMGLTDFSEGAYVQAAQDLSMLVDNSRLLVNFKVPETYLNDIGVGQVAEIRLDGFPDQVFRAMVEAIDSRIDPLSHSIAVQASIPNKNNKLKSGLFASVSLIIGEKSNSILIPEAAVQREGEIEFVWIVQDGKADRRRVVTSTRENAQIEIVAGLRKDEIVITSGQLKVTPGTKVKITNMPELYAQENPESEKASNQDAPTDSAEKKAEPQVESAAEPAEAATEAQVESAPQEPEKQESEKKGQ